MFYGVAFLTCEAFGSPCLAEVKADTKNSRCLHPKFVLTWRILIDAPCACLSVPFRDSRIRNFSCDTGFSQMFRIVWSVKPVQYKWRSVSLSFFLASHNDSYQSALFNRYSWDTLFKLRNVITYCIYTACQGVCGYDAVWCRRIVRFETTSGSRTLIQYVVNFE